MKQLAKTESSLLAVSASPLSQGGHFLLKTVQKRAGKHLGIACFAQPRLNWYWAARRHKCCYPLRKKRWTLMKIQAAVLHEANQVFSIEEV
jgi:hypothetical protein